MIDRKSEFIEHLFNTISNDPEMSAELKVSLLRLQLPIHNLSLTDPNFITNTKHPARRTILIAKKISSLANNNAKIIRKIDLILSTLYTSTSNINNFLAANKQLDKLVTLIQQSTTKTTAPKAEPKSNIKQVLSNRIKLCIQGHEIPAPCQDLVLKLWPNVLFSLLKTHGEESTHWNNAIEIYNELLDSIQNITSKSQRDHLKESFMNVVRRNNNILLLYHQDHKVESAIKSLITHYNHILGNTTLSNTPDTNAHKRDLKNTAILPKEVKPGVWCEIYIDDATPKRRLRLSLINMQTDTLIFVNRKGIKKLEKDAAEFTHEIECGLSMIYSHDALFTKPSTKKQLKKIG